MRRCEGGRAHDKYTTIKNKASSSVGGRSVGGCGKIPSRDISRRMFDRVFRFSLHFLRQVVQTPVWIFVGIYSVSMSDRQFFLKGRSWLPVLKTGSRNTEVLIVKFSFKIIILVNSQVNSFWNVRTSQSPELQRLSTFHPTPSSTFISTQYLKFYVSVLLS